MQRDPERTRRRILAASEKEFSAKGFAGARVDAIARRARVNKRMLYHYFGNKEGLFREILLRKLTREDSPFRPLDPWPADPAEHMLHFHEAASRNPDFIRLLEWEALTLANRRLIGEEERRAEELDGIARIERAQAEGTLPAGLDPAQWLLTMMGAIMFPFAFPQMTRLVTGFAPHQPEFVQRRIEFLRRFARCLEQCSFPEPPEARPADPASRKSRG